MTEIYALVIETFKCFLAKDSDLLINISMFSGDIYVQEDRLVFALPALREFILNWHNQRNNSSSVCNYQEFRKMLYQNPTNQILSEYGGQIQIEKPGATVDTTLYKLVRIDQ